MLRLRPARFSRFAPRSSGRVSRPKRRPVEKPVFSQKTGFCLGLPQGAGRFLFGWAMRTRRSQGRVWTFPQGAAAAIRRWTAFLAVLPPPNGNVLDATTTRNPLSLLSLLRLLSLRARTPAFERPFPTTRAGSRQPELPMGRGNPAWLLGRPHRVAPTKNSFAGEQTTPPRKQKSENQNSEINCGGKSSTPPPPATRGCCCR